jgi:thiamine-phosphate pyrophosphorylase
MVDFRLYVITDRKQCDTASLADVVSAACAAGVRAVQLREKDLDGKALHDLAVDVRDVVSMTGTTFLINDRVDVALAVEADGVHCPENGFPPSDARRLLGTKKIIGASVHSVREAVRAEAEQADFIVFGPVFETASKPDAEAQGLEQLRKVAASVTIPVFAIGGITPTNVGQCLKHGARGVAVVSAIMTADDVIGAVSEFNTALDGL